MRQSRSSHTRQSGTTEAASSGRHTTKRAQTRVPTVCRVQSSELRHETRDHKSFRSAYSSLSESPHRENLTESYRALQSLATRRYQASPDSTRFRQSIRPSLPRQSIVEREHRALPLLDSED